MGQYTFASIWYFDVPESDHLAPHGTNFALWEHGHGHGQDPANSYNAYSTPKPGEYIFQSQLNGMYVGMTAGSGLVCASFSDPAQAQPLIPIPYHPGPNWNVTILYLPDKVHFLGRRDDRRGWAWQTDIGGNYLYNDGGLQPTSWSYSEILAGKGTGGLTLNYVNLTDAFLHNVSVVRADFSHCNLTNAQFADVNLSGAVLTGANLTDARFMDCTLDGAFLTNCTLTNTVFMGSTLLGTHLEGATFQNTVLFNTRLAGAVYKQSDLTGVIAKHTQFYNTPLVPPSATNPRTSLAGCRLDQSLVTNDWSMLDLTDATILNLSSPLSSQTKPLKATYAILKGLNQNNLVGLSLQNAVFDYAVLDGLGLNTSGSQTSDLTGASFIQASMHGTNLTGAILKGAKMSGSGKYARFP
jgi:uncharacterized protein YjbI with pentapeptide repeats